MKMFRRLRRKSPAEKAVHILVSIVFMAVALSYIYILVWAVISGCKTHEEVVMDAFSLPEKWHWEHFGQVISMLKVNGHGFWEMLCNSIYFSVACVFVQQLVSITFAYCVAKYKFPGSKLIYTVVMVVITLPIYGSSGAAYNLYHRLGLIDSYGQIVGSFNGFNLYFLYYLAFFKSVSGTYAEAAKIDGADHFKTYWKIIFPQAKPIFGAMFLTEWIQVWNSYESALVYLPNKPTLPVGIYQFNTEMIYSARLDILFAACVIITIPALILFIVFNKTITTSVSVGGIKG